MLGGRQEEAHVNARQNTPETSPPAVVFQEYLT